jgi:hypothetical protein
MQCQAAQINNAKDNARKPNGKIKISFKERPYEQTTNFEQQKRRTSCMYRKLVYKPALYK